MIVSESDCYINQIETAVPQYEFHNKCIDFLQKFIESKVDLDKINEIIPNLGINHRYSVLENLIANPDHIDSDSFYQVNRMPSTAERMQVYRTYALTLVTQALEKLFVTHSPKDITHLLITSCTGFYSPGIDIEIIQKFNLNPNIERTIVGFMGCHAAINALKLAKHINQSNHQTKILIVNIELSTLHFQENAQINQVISNLIFADGCAVTIVSKEASGIQLGTFNSTLIPESRESMTWNIADNGFTIFLDKSIPIFIKKYLPGFLDSFINIKDVKYWSIHPGGRAILNTVQKVLSLTDADMSHSNKILENYGNMSSATIMFILKAIMQEQGEPGLGLICAFGPGLAIETLAFRKL